MKSVLKYAGNTAKIMMFIAFMIICMAAFIASINETLAAEPVKNVTITGEDITLGDIFDGIKGKNTGFILAPAPLPNETITWGPRTLNRVAQAFNIPWRAGVNDQITIRRLASIVTEDMIEKKIIESLSKNGLNDNIDLDFVGDKAHIILDYGIEPTVTVLSSSYNASRQTFSAALRTLDNQTHEFTGVASPLIAVPVLKTPLRRGDMITRNMIKTMNIRQDYLTADMVLSIDSMIGMTPRRVLRADAPIDIDDLDKPTVVNRGDLVTMQFENGPIKITAVAKAMESGTKGDIIRLMNVDSKRSVEAMVTGLKEVKIIN